MKKTVFLMAMMSAVALVSVSCRNGGDNKNEKSTETQIPIEKKILGKWYAKNFSMVSGNPATPNEKPIFYDKNDCKKQTYWDFGGDGKNILTAQEYDISSIDGTCVKETPDIYQYKIEGDKIEFKKSYEDENHETKWWIYKGEVKEIKDKSLVLEMKHDLNEDGTDDILTFTFYRK